MKVELTFIEPLLGTLPGNKEIAEEFIISKHPKGVSEEESDSVDESIEKSSTIFARNDAGKPMLWDYQIKGFFKAACLAMIYTDAFKKEDLKKVRLTEYLYKRSIDNLVFVSPRQIPLILPNKNKLDFCERPLRGQTMRGERIALARSEMAPAGTTIILEITTLNPKLDPFIERWLDYGRLSGLGQWRNSGMGRFEWKKLKSQ